MEQQQDELFQLIKALNKSEKKFFTQYVNLYEKGSSPMYLQVFDFFNLEESYDEEKLFKKFRDPLFKKNYAVTRRTEFQKNIVKTELKVRKHYLRQGQKQRNMILTTAEKKLFQQLNDLN